MTKRVKSAAVKKADVVAKKPSDGFGMVRLLEYLESLAVSEIKIVEVSKSAYRLEFLLTWKPERSVLMSARGGVRTFRSLDTVAKFLKTVRVGETVVRLELRKS